MHTPVCSATPSPCSTLHQHWSPIHQVIYYSIILFKVYPSLLLGWCPNVLERQRSALNLCCVLLQSCVSHHYTFYLSQINKCLVVKLHNSTRNTPHSFIKYLDILNTKLLSGRLLQMPLRLVTVGVQYSSVFRCISQYISSVHSAIRAVDRGLHENDTILLYLHSLGSELTNDSSISIRWNRCLGMKGEWTGFCSLWGQSCAESRHWSQ